jgi:hypothetical protein
MPEHEYRAYRETIARPSTRKSPSSNSSEFKRITNCNHVAQTSGIPWVRRFSFVSVVRRQLLQIPPRP